MPDESPATPPDTRLRLIPLGGLGEIGMNCMVLEADGDLVVVDCGVTFPNARNGVNLIHADFQWLVERRHRLRGIVVTHGHEDHIGAVPYLVRDAPAPVWGPPYALGLIRHRADELGLRDLDLRETQPRVPFRVGPIEVEPVRVTHSIADATALVLRTPAGIVVHSGDFKIDDDPIDGAHFDRDRLRAVGDEGVRLLLSDSTNSFVDGVTGEERSVAEALEREVAAAPHRVVVTLFASNVHRLRALVDVAERTGRRLLLLGRSLGNHARNASETGYLPDLGDRLVRPEDARDVPRRELLVLATGTQGEAPAAMARLAAGTHPVLDIEAGDTVLFSARVIPGNEVSVHDLLNTLARRGIDVRFRGTHPELHVSGHAQRGEQAELLRLVRPEGFLPVHGTLVHMKRHAALAEELGVRQTLVVENGAVVELDEDGLRVVDQVPSGRVHIDAGEPVPDVVLKERSRLAELGYAAAFLIVDESGRLHGPPRITTSGVLDVLTEADLLRDASRAVAGELRKLASDLRRVDDDAVTGTARRALRRFFGRELGRKPLVDAHVARLE